ncbi:hypothetical protein RND71_035843 [Anisodus tanguticus]|uniref:Uncharacterized protein n=1 Tax=Anisodus tanguticus TaxID=243964 RepID=A0AAE1UW73_9SOLA|nr:hypothetical protein RND71_035843 [Anisodus tanguticus]
MAVDGGNMFWIRANCKDQHTLCGTTASNLSGDSQDCTLLGLKRLRCAWLRDGSNKGEFQGHRRISNQLTCNSKIQYMRFNNHQS